MTTERARYSTPHSFHFPSGWMSPNPSSKTADFSSLIRYLTCPSTPQYVAFRKLKAIRLAVNEWLEQHPEEDE